MCSLAVRTQSVTISSNSGRERRLNAVIAKYLQAAESGRKPARKEFLERHWDLTDGLVSFFANEDCLKRIAGLPAVPARANPHHSPQIQSTGSLDDFRRRLALGEFELLNEIARGGMGVVYKARHKRLNRIVALKTIRPGGSYSAEVLVRRLRAEARVVAALDHPNIVPLYQIGEEAGCPYLILKLIVQVVTSRATGCD